MKKILNKIAQKWWFIPIIFLGTIFSILGLKSIQDSKYMSWKKTFLVYQHPHGKTMIWMGYGDSADNRLMDNDGDGKVDFVSQIILGKLPALVPRKATKKDQELFDYVMK